MKWLNSVLVIGLSLWLAGCVGGGKHYMGKGSCPGGVCMPKYGHGKMMEKAGHINTQGLKNLIDAKTNVIILDARSGKYDDGRRVPGARSLSSEATAEQVSSVINDKDSLIVTYCTNLQCPASARLAKHLKKLGYTNILEYSEGIEGWVDAGYDIEKKS